MDIIVGLLIGILGFSGGYIYNNKTKNNEIKEITVDSNNKLDIANNKIDSLNYIVKQGNTLLKESKIKIDSLLNVTPIIIEKTDTLILINKSILNNTDTIKNEMREYIYEVKNNR